MLPKKLKLPISGFPNDAKVIWRDDFALIKAAPNNLGFHRLGITFKPKSTKGSVERNQFKRSIFNFFKDAPQFKKKPQEKGMDLLIILNPSKMKFTREELRLKFKKYDSLFI